MKNAKQKAASQIKNALEKLTVELEKGTSQQFKKFLAAMAKFHRYSWGNALLITLQRSDAKHVAGYRTWQKLGRQVKKGQKGILIMAPIVYRRRQANEREAKEEDERTVGLKAAYVFDVSQTDGKELPEPVTVEGDPRFYLERLKQFVQSHDIKLEYASLNSVEGFAGKGRIVVRQDLEPGEEFSTMVHELSHALLHVHDGVPEAKTVRETEAEAIAYIVCEAVGLQTNTASSDYIALCKGSKDTLAKSLQRIQETAGVIIDGLKDEDEGNAASMEPAQQYSVAA